MSAAREHAWQAQLATQRAIELAARHPNALAWGKTTLYSGETTNGRPHGGGVMSFLDRDGEISASYRGEFAEGRRTGHGVGQCADGMTWSGQGRRYEGEVEPGADGAPLRCGGWLWTPNAPPRGQIKIEPQPALPAPAK